MSLSEIDVSGALRRAKELAASDKKLGASVRAVLELLVLIIELLLRRLNVNSRNSSVPPSQDRFRKKGAAVTSAQRRRKSGGQVGHKGQTITPIANPDEVKDLSIDRRTLPRGHEYRRIEDEKRQIIDIVIHRHVTEYRAEVLEDEQGREYRAEFPPGVTRPVQYGNSIKAAAVYQLGYQLLPLNRVQDFFRDQAGLEISEGTLHTFRREAYERLERFEAIARQHLIGAPIAHFDETGINIGGKLAWLHSASNDKWTLYGAHAKRGQEGIDALGVLPNFSGIACHDHWKPYFRYECIHALCNAHHTRELTGVIENEGHTWAQQMKDLIERIHAAVSAAGGALSPKTQAAYRKQYRDILTRANNECPLNDSRDPHQRGKTKQSKARNLLDRLREFEDETLRFITNSIVPFTNNQAERDIRMTKLQQKTSGCFRAIEGAQIFARLRSYLSTCDKHGVSATEALTSLFSGTLPDFLCSLGP